MQCGVLPTRLGGAIRPVRARRTAQAGRSLELLVKEASGVDAVASAAEVSDEAPERSPTLDGDDLGVSRFWL